MGHRKHIGFTQPAPAPLSQVLLCWPPTHACAVVLTTFVCLSWASPPSHLGRCQSSWILRISKTSGGEVGEQGGNFRLSPHVATVISIVLICTSPAGLVALYCFHYTFGARGCLLRSLWSLPQMHQQSFPLRAPGESNTCALCLWLSLSELTCLHLSFSLVFPLSLSPLPLHKQAERSSSSLGRERGTGEKVFVRQSQIFL